MGVNEVLIRFLRHPAIESNCEEIICLAHSPPSAPKLQGLCTMSFLLMNLYYAGARSLHGRTYQWHASEKEFSQIAQVHFFAILYNSLTNKICACIYYWTRNHAASEICSQSDRLSHDVHSGRYFRSKHNRSVWGICIIHILAYIFT